MGRRRLWRWAVAGLLTFAAMQFVPVDRSGPPVGRTVAAPPQVQEILVAACFDCHSAQTKWPWYARVAPLSWWIADHVHDGRRNLDFSNWPAFDLAAQDLLLKEIAKEVESGEMPLASYKLGHPEARLDEAQKARLLSWARTDDSAEEDLPY